MPSSTDKATRRRSLSLRVLLPLTAVTLLGGAVALATFLSLREERDATRAAVTQQVRERLSNMQLNAELLIKLKQPDYLANVAASVAAERDLEHLVIVAPNGEVLASNRFSQAGEPWWKVVPDLDRAQISAAMSSRGISSINPGHSDLVDGYAALCGFTDNTTPLSGDCGFMAYRVNLEPHLARTLTTLGDHARYFVVGIFAVTVILLLLLDLRITRRTGIITDVLNDFTAGRRHARVPIAYGDEISRIGTSVNQVLEDIQQYEAGIIDERERLRATFDAVGDAIITVDEAGIIHRTNPATESLFGYTRDELVGQHASLLLPAKDRARYVRLLNRLLAQSGQRLIGSGREVVAVNRSGTAFPVEFTASTMTIGGKRMYTAVLRDITERVALREAMEQTHAQLVATNENLWRSAKTDPLTGLANRRNFDETLLEELRRATRHGTLLSLVILDIDHFKRYNDTYGHIEGDKAIRAVASVLQECSQRSGELAARYGGEEFAVILPGTDPDHGLIVADRIRARVAALGIEHSASDTARHVTVSVGVTSYNPLHSLMPEPETLVEAADKCLYAAKSSGRNTVRHAPFVDREDPATGSTPRRRPRRGS